MIKAPPLFKNGGVFLCVSGSEEERVVRMRRGKECIAGGEEEWGENAKVGVGALWCIGGAEGRWQSGL